jgi:hypothetical protein
MSENVVLFFAGQIIMAMGVYAAIRADLREYNVRIGMLEKHNEDRRYK